jgi:hypothetical protein
MKNKRGLQESGIRCAVSPDGLRRKEAGSGCKPAMRLGLKSQAQRVFGAQTMDAVLSLNGKTMVEEWGS